MRLPLVILCVLIGSHGLLADLLALTVKDVSLMLRSGYSSKAILAEIATRHFAETLDANSESDLVELHASPELISALKSGEHAASLSEALARVTVPIQQAEEAKRITQDAMNRQPVAQPQSQFVVAPAQTNPITFLTPSEVAAKQREAKLAAIAERARYCAEHVVECEMLKEIKAARSDAQSARSDLESLKTDLWMQGIRR